MMASPACLAQISLRRFVLFTLATVTLLLPPASLLAQTGDPVLQRWVRYEIRNRLCEAGLPAPEPMGMAGVPPRPAAMAIIREQLNTVDWREAVRGGVQRAVVRGGNEWGALSKDQLREAVTDAVVDSMNASAAGADDSTSFQQLVEEGVEDAMVQLLNAMAAKNQPAAPSKTNVAAQPMPAIERRPLPAALIVHLPANHGDFFPARYLRLREVHGGWYQDRNGAWQPLVASSAVLAIRRDDNQLIDIWLRGRLAAASTRFVTHFEETQ